MPHTGTKTARPTVIYSVVVWTFSFSKQRDFLGRAYLTALPTRTIRPLWTHHINRVLFALTSLCPQRAVLILIDATPASCMLQRFLKGSDMNPLGCWPFLTFNNWTTPVQAVCVSRCVGMKTEEQQCITLLGFHCNDIM